MVGKRDGSVIFGLTMLLGVGALLTWAQNAHPAGEQERKAKESEVPAAALSALKSLAGGAALTEFSEETEHGHRFYEGSWKGADGNVDALVTEAGDVVEIEETTPAAKVPAAVRAAVEKEAGKEAKLAFERKTVYMYEVHFRKDGKVHEILYSPDARVLEQETESDGDDEGEGKP